jgi:hypothetical protein
MSILEKLFDSTPWERKFEHQIPESPTLVWREQENEQAKKYLNSHQEETTKICRSLWLFSDSLGQALAVVEGDWK